jgi:hypothetical protein
MQAFITLFTSLILMTTDVEAKEPNHVAAALSQMDGVTTLSFSKEMIGSIDTDFDINDHMKHVEGDFHEIRLNILNDETPNLAEKKETMLKVLKKHYKEVEIEEDEESNEVLFFVRNKGKHVEEAHLMVLDDEDNSFTIISFIGDVIVTEKED